MFPSADPEFVASFLLTYRTFATAREVLRLLAARFNIPTPSGLTDKALADLKRDYITPVRLRYILFPLFFSLLISTTI